MKSKDRIIDTFLAELIGGETPPDLTRQILERARQDVDARDADSREVRVAEDQILNVCLDELLGDITPPLPSDVTYQVMSHLHESGPTAFEPAAPPLPRPVEQDRSIQAHAELLAPPLPAHAGEANKVTSKVTNRVAVTPRRRRMSRRVARAPWLLVGASALACLLAAGIYWSGGEGGSRGPSVAERELERDSGPDDGIVGGTKQGGASQVGGSAIAAKPKTSKPEPAFSPFNDPLFSTDDLFVGSDDGPKSATIDDPAKGDPAKGALKSSQRLSDDEVVRAMNQLLAKSWREAGVTAAPASDEQWCRRLYLQLLGRIPTVEELQQFSADIRPDRREKLIAMLQDSEQYRDEYASHWAAFWGTVLVGRRGGMGVDDTASREHLEEYLAEAIKAERPYDELVRELIVAEGSGRPGAEDYNPAANFLLASMDNGGDKKALLATTRTFQVFHGRQVKCIQCHPHPSNSSWSQEQFWSLNAFFRQMQLKRGKAGPMLIDRDFRGEGPGGIQEAEVFFERVNGETVAALPSYPNRGPINPHGRLDQVKRREVLADLMVQDPQLARAAINRIWSHFHGFGFTKPVDDMGPHNPVSHPDLMELLARQFAGNGYAMDQLVRWVAASDGFSRTSQMTVAAAKDSPEAGGRPLFSRYYTRQLQPEAVYDSLRMVADADAPQENSLEGRARWLGQFIQPMGTDEGQELSTYGGDVRQSLIIMNGPLMKKATSSGNREGVLHSVLNSSLDFDGKVEHLFLAAVARKPTLRELSAVRELGLRQGPKADVAVVLESVWWALLNSNEFILDH